MVQESVVRVGGQAVLSVGRTVSWSETTVAVDPLQSPGNTSSAAKLSLTCLSEVNILPSLSSPFQK